MHIKVTKKRNNFKNNKRKISHTMTVYWPMIPPKPPPKPSIKTKGSGMATSI